MKDTVFFPTRLLVTASVAGLMTAAFLHGPSAGAADTYPAKPVRFLVPFAPGGGNDIIARLIGQKLAGIWGQQLIVDNRPGAGGNVAGEITAKAAPDGYTLFQFNVANVIAVSLYPKLGYDPAKDFSPITQLATSPFMVLVHPAVKANSVKELIALAKSQPKLLSYGSSGNGGATHLLTEVLKASAGIEMTHIPYNGAGPAMNDLLGGQIQFMLGVPATSLPHMKTGRVRAIAVTSARRSVLTPELPTVAESGVPKFEGSTWYGVVAPARTPQPIVNRLHADITATLKEPDLRERLASQGVEIVGSTPAAFGDFIHAEIPKWRDAVRLSGARID